MSIVDGTRSKAESVFLAAIELRGLNGFSVKPQWRIARICVDFVFFHEDSRRVIVEIDGPEHNSKSGRATDRYRDETLGRFGIGVYRIKNSEVFENPDECAARVLQMFNTLPILTTSQIVEYDNVYRTDMAERRLLDNWRIPKVTVTDPYGMLESSYAHRAYMWHLYSAVDTCERRFHEDVYDELYYLIQRVPRPLTVDDVFELYFVVACKLFEDTWRYPKRPKRWKITAGLEARSAAAGHSSTSVTQLYDRETWRGREAFEKMPEVEDLV